MPPPHDTLPRAPHVLLQDLPPHMLSQCIRNVSAPLDLTQFDQPVGDLLLDPQLVDLDVPHLPEAPPGSNPLSCRCLNNANNGRALILESDLRRIPLFQLRI